jgi:hypothetical protein
MSEVTSINGRIPNPPSLTVIRERKTNMSTLSTHLRGIGLLVAILVACAHGLLIWFALRNDYALGMVVSTSVVTNQTDQIAELNTPWRASRILRLGAHLKFPMLAGRWVVVQGTPRMIEQWPILDVKRIRAFPIVHAGAAVPWSSASQFRFMLHQHRTVTLLLGVTVLLLGTVLVRLAGRKLGGLIGAALAWHAVTVVSFEQLIVLSELGAWLSLIMGFVIGVSLAGHQGNIFSFLTRRLGLMLVLVTLSDAIADLFGWPSRLVQVGTLLGTLIATGLGIWVLSSFLLAIGLNATSVGNYVTLAVTGLAVCVLFYGSQDAMNEAVSPRWLKRLWPKGANTV